MLSSENLEKKTYEEWREEAILQIPLYSSEWTNYNVSDPGITILENFTAFSVLQQESIHEISDAVRANLLEMVGFRRRNATVGCVFLKAEAGEEVLYLPSHQKFYSGELCFETDKKIRTNYGKIVGIYREKEETNLYLEIKRYEAEDGFAIWGEHPQEGDTIYIVLSALPKISRTIDFYVEVGERFPRTKAVQHTQSLFATLAFSLLTCEGYQEMDVMDETVGLLQSGNLSLQMPKAKGCISQAFPEEGYVIRVELKRSEYDIYPSVKGIHGILFPVLQRESKALVMCYQGSKKLKLCNAMLEDHYFFCFVKEGEFYRSYLPWDGIQRNGRFYETNKVAYGCMEVCFDQEKFGYGPVCGSDREILCMYCSEEVMIHRNLGRVLGYDEQTISVHPFTNLLKDDFCVMVKKEEKGEEIYGFFAPDEVGKTSLCYRLESNTSQIVIMDAGDWEGAEIFLAGVVSFAGEAGNIRGWNQFETTLDEQKRAFLNPAAGSGGHIGESLLQVMNRFAKDVEYPFSLVTSEDYTVCVRQIPMLCIHKVHAFWRKEHNTMVVVVKPYSDDPFPKCSDLYHRVIQAELNKRRILNTKVELKDPVYVPIHVSAFICRKDYAVNYEKQVEETIRAKLDGITTTYQFGEKILFYEIYQAIERLTCVEEIKELSLLPANMDYVKQSGLDLLPEPHCLCYMGNIQLEFYQK